MWFRNLRPYRLPERLGLSAEELEQRLSSRPFVPCRPAQPLSTGWVGALADSAEALVHAAGPFWLVRLRREEKLLPASVVRDEVQNRVSQIQIAEGRKVYRKGCCKCRGLCLGSDQIVTRSSKQQTQTLNEINKQTTNQQQTINT